MDKNHGRGNYPSKPVGEGDYGGRARYEGKGDWGDKKGGERGRSFTWCWSHWVAESELCVKLTTWLSQPRGGSRKKTVTHKGGTRFPRPEGVER